MARRAKEKGRISDELLDELLAGEDPAEAFRNGELPSEMKKAVAERALNAEMDHHLSREPESGSHRNGHNRKRVATESGSMDLAVPRDRRGSFEPALAEKHVRRLPGFDDKAVFRKFRGVFFGIGHEHLHWPGRAVSCRQAHRQHRQRAGHARAAAVDEPRAPSARDLAFGEAQAGVHRTRPRGITIRHPAARSRRRFRPPRQRRRLLLECQGSVLVRSRSDPGPVPDRSARSASPGFQGVSPGTQRA